MRGFVLRGVILLSVALAGAAQAEGWPDRPLGFAPIPEAAPPDPPCRWPKDCPHRGTWILYPPARAPEVRPLPTLSDARALVEAGRFAAAKVLLDGLAARSPQDPGVWALRGRAERRLGQLDAAGESLRRALALDPGHPGALEEQGFLHLARGQGGQALSTLDRLTASCGTCAEAIRLRSALTGAGYHAGGTGAKWIRRP